MSETVIQVQGTDLDAMQSKTTTIDFVANDTKNEKAPKFTYLIANQGVLAGTVTAGPVFIKDGAPTASVAKVYGQESLRIRQIPEDFHGRTFYAPDLDGRDKLGKLDAAVRVAFYAWQKSGKPQPFSLA